MPPAPPPLRPHQAIVFVVDGMGPVQRQLGSLVAGGLAMDGQKVWGLVRTGALEAPAPDTAAACSALATGRPGRQGVLSYDDGQPVRTLLEAAREAGLGTGVVTNLTVTHASVAGFMAHASRHDDEDGIAHQYHSEAPDVLLGGGRRHFGDALAGYHLVETRDALAHAPTGRLLGLFAPGALPSDIDHPDTPSLADMTSAALQQLAGHGFVLVVNQGRLDWECHDHDGAAVARDVLATDEAFKVAATFQAAHPDTLVVVVGSHETSGLAITGDFRLAPLRAARNSLGTVAEAIRADRAHAETTVKTLLGWSDLTTEERESLLLASDPARAVPAPEPGNDPLVQALGRIESSRSGLAWASQEHTGDPCPLSVSGPGAGTFLGPQDAADVPRKLAHLLGLSL
ncbi:MAG TPA: alkaline phosphatase [Candidatus Xenobia bacterium]